MPTFQVSPLTVASAIAYNTGSATATSIDVDTLTSVTGGPTAWFVGATGSATTGVSDNGASLAISTSGVVSYTPVAGYRGSDAFYVRARNDGGESLPLVVLVTVGDPTFSASVADPTATVASAYAQQVTITGGKAPYSAFSATGLPPGLSISSSGLITGTPTTAGSYTATITVTDSSTGPGTLPAIAPAPSSEYTGTASLALTVVLPPVPTFNAYPLTYGTTVSYNTGSATAASIDVATLGAVTGSPTVWYVDVSGTTTSGSSAFGGAIAITTAGVVSYTPPVGFYGTDNFDVRAVNAGGESAPVRVLVTVGQPSYTASVANANATVDTAYSQQVTIAGGKAPYSAFSATGLPPGLTISSDGLISGTPTTAGSYTATITVTDSSTSHSGGCGFCLLPGPSGYTGTASLALAVSAPGVPTFSSPALTYGTTLPYNTGRPRPPPSTSPPSAPSPARRRSGTSARAAPPPRAPRSTAPPSRSPRPASSPTRPSPTIAAATASRSAPATAAASPSRSSCS